MDPEPVGPQGWYQYTADPYEQAYWDHDDGPEAQLDDWDALGLGGLSGARDFAVMSGGEIRGINRAAGHNGTSNDETLASITCGLQNAVCAGLEPGAGCSYGSGGSCTDMFLDPLADPSFSPCDCSGWAPDVANERRLIVSDENFSAWHLGWRDHYQSMYGGFEGTTTDARDFIATDAVFLAWWHFDSRKQEKFAVVGNEMALGKVEDAAEAGFDSVVAPGQDPELARALAAAAAGAASPTPKNPAPNWRGLLGLVQFGWGADDEAPLHLLQSGWYFWQTDWGLLETWYLDDVGAEPDPLYAGSWHTDDTEWSLDVGPVQRWGKGFLNPTTAKDVSLPIYGYNVDANTFTWTSDPVDLEPEWVVAAEPPGGGAPLPIENAWALLRFYARPNMPTNGCDIDVTFHWYAAGTLLASDAGMITVGDCGDGMDNNNDGQVDNPVGCTLSPESVFEDGQGLGQDLVVFSARAPFDVHLPTVDQVAVELEVEGCSETVSLPGGGTATYDFQFHNPSLYQGMPRFDWV